VEKACSLFARRLPHPGIRERTPGAGLPESLARVYGLSDAEMWSQAVFDRV